MADQNDSNNDLVGLDHLAAAVGKTHTFRLPRGKQAPLFAIKPSALAPTSEEARRVFDDIMANPSTVVLFEDGEPTDAAPTLDFSAHYEIYGREVAKRGGSTLDALFRAASGHLPPPDVSDDGTVAETAREHNERKYPDLMRRINELDRMVND